MDDPTDVPEDVLRLAEAFVFASPDPVTPHALARLLPPGLAPEVVLAALEGRCARRGVVLAEVGGGWQFRTAPDLAPRLRPALAPPRRLPRAAMEALAVVALQQPVTRAGIERHRAASVGQGTMDLLVETGLIRPCGRQDSPGRPTLWATTPEFLAQFGLRSLRDLPGSDLPPLPTSDQRRVEPASADGLGSDTASTSGERSEGGCGEAPPGCEQPRQRG